MVEFGMLIYTFTEFQAENKPTFLLNQPECIAKPAHRSEITDSV